MKPMDLSGLIKGLMVVIGIAMALGRLDDLKRWAVREALPHYKLGRRVRYRVDELRALLLQNRRGGIKNGNKTRS